MAELRKGSALLRAKSFLRFHTRWLIVKIAKECGPSIPQILIGSNCLILTGVDSGLPHQIAFEKELPRIN